MQAYDQHLNMVLGDVEETLTTVEVDAETGEEIVKVRRRVRVGALLGLCPRARVQPDGPSFLPRPALGQPPSILEPVSGTLELLAVPLQRGLARSWRGDVYERRTRTAAGSGADAKLLLPRLTRRAPPTGRGRWLQWLQSRSCRECADCRADRA